MRFLPKLFYKLGLILMNLPNPETQCEELAQLIAPKLPQQPLLVGIYSGGSLVAERVKRFLNLNDDALGFLDVSFYRDDVHKKGLHAAIKPTQIPLSVENRLVILIDDVLFTGRTTRAAMSEIFDYGRPQAIELAVLADRKGRELPIAPNYCVWEISLKPSQKMHLSYDENQKLRWSLQENA